MALTPGKMARWTSIGVESTSPIIGGAIVGHYLDLYFSTDPWLTLAMCLLGVFTGFYRLVKMLGEIGREV